MKIAFRELIRRPGRFVAAAGALTLIVVLVLILGGLLDGLYLDATGAYRAQSAAVIVFSKDSKDQLIRSRIEPAVRAKIAAVPGVQDTDGLGVLQISAAVPERTAPVDIALIGYEAPNLAVPAPPADAQAWADRSLAASGVRVGQTLQVGPEGVPVTVQGWVSDTKYQAQPGVWVNAATWREATAASRPEEVLAPGAFQAILVTPADGTDPQALITALEQQVPGIDALTKDETIMSIPGVKEQVSTFTAIIYTTLAVAGLVVALFFALLTLERIGLFGVLKAIGISTGSLAGGLVLQAVLITLAAFAVGSLITLGLAQVLPSTIPLSLQPSRALFTLVGVGLTAVIGSAISFRRVIRVDPASAVGGS